MADKRFTLPPSHPREPYYWNEGGKPGSGGLPQRLVTRLTTPSIDPLSGKVVGEIVFPNVAGCTLLSFAAAQDTWFRLYASVADRDADKDRSIDTFPPTTPIIFDGLVRKGDLATQLSRVRWGPGPGCINPGRFGSATDGDGSTWWATDYYLGAGHPPAADMSVGDTFSVDFGEPIVIGSCMIRNGTGALNLPLTFSVETSMNGSLWNMDIPAFETAGSASPLINFSTPVTARYLRLRVVSANPGSGPWQIAEFSAYATNEDSLLLRLTNGDEMGIPCFNWDDRAQPKLYYAAQCDPDDLFNIYHASFGHGPCQLYAWNFSGPGGTIVVYTEGPPQTEDCILTGELWPPAGVSFVDPGGIRPRYFQIGNELRCFGFGGVARIDRIPSDMTVAVAQLVLQRSSALDTSSFEAGVAYYVSNASNFDDKIMLKIGVTRASSGSIRGTIVWRDDSGAEHSLISGPLFTLGLGGECTLTAYVYQDSGDTIAVCALNGVEQCRYLVPSEVLDVAPSHQYVAFYASAADPPDATYAWGGIGIEACQIAGGSGRGVIDLGYVPMESPGGTLKKPAV